MGARTFGNYRLERLLGHGGMGEVWLARDPAGRLVALKILAAALTSDAEYRRRFQREAQICAGLQHPHLVSIHHFGEHDGRLYIDMEYIRGTDLSRLVGAGRTVQPAAAVDIITQIADALDAVHEAGLIHRDIKPANIIVTSDGTAYLIDFGVAHSSGQTSLTATGTTIGTLEYLAPERFSGTVDSRSDVYSLACVLYECLAGRRPFDGGDLAQQMHAVLKTQPLPLTTLDPTLPPNLARVVARGMAKQPAERYPSAGALAEAARRTLGAPPTRVPATVLLAESAAPVPTLIATTALPAEGAAPPRAATRIATAALPGGDTAPPRTPTRAVPSLPAESRPRVGRRAAWATAVLVGLAAVVGALFAATSLDPNHNAAAATDSAPSSPVFASPAPVAPAQPTKSAAAEPDTTAGDGGFDFVVDHIQQGVHKIGSDSTHGQYVIVQVTVTNIGQDPRFFIPAYQRLVDADGHSYTVNDRAMAQYRRQHDGSSRIGRIAPGDSTAETLIFELPDGSTPDQLRLRDSQQSDGVDLPL